MDELARNLIQHNLDTTYLVEAGAGTGKTTLLVARIINLIKTGKARFPQIAAITFTEKAAEELKTRIKKQLAVTLREEKDSLAWKRLNLAHREIDKACLNTIHGFCASILRQFPLEAGILPGFNVIEPILLQKFVTEIWQEWSFQKIKSYDQKLFSLLSSGIELDKIEQIAKLFLAHREFAKVKDSLESSAIDFSKFRSYFLEKVKSLQEKKEYCIDEKDKGYIAIIEIVKNWEILETQSIEQFIFSLLNGINIPSGGNQKNWNPSDILKQIKSDLKELKQYNGEIRTLHSHNLCCLLIEWLCEFIAFFYEKKQQQGILDFDDLLYYTRDLLKTNISVRLKCQETFSYILIDEFQDTNSLQVETLFLLAKNNNDDNLPWYSTTLVPGKLFMVGDPKQSIYRFRGADIEVYETVKDMLGKDNCLFITRNFRSAHSIIDWCNEVFTDLIQRPTDGKYQPDYVPLQPSRHSISMLDLNNVVFINGKGNDAELNQNNYIQLEAKYIASTIHRIIAEEWKIYKDGKIVTCQYCDIAILFRRYTHVDLFENILSSSDIPYQVIGGKSSHSRIEIKSLLSLLKSLLNPLDAISLLAILRSPVFCISDECILLHIEKYSKLSYLEKFEEKTHVINALSILARLHKMLGKGSGYQWLQNVYQESGILMTFMTMKQGEQQAYNLQKVLHIAKSKELTKLGDIRDFVVWLSEVESFQETNLEEQFNAVRIFSIHKSKGLEFGVVILADMTANINHSPNIIIDEHEKKLALRLQSNFETKNYAELVEKEKKRITAEDKRLLYVALTRARDYLCIPVMGKQQGFLGFLQKGVNKTTQSIQNIDIDVDVSSNSKGITFSSTAPVKLKEISCISESKWYAHRQRWLHQHKKEQQYKKKLLNFNEISAVLSDTKSLVKIVECYIRKNIPLAESLQKTFRKDTNNLIEFLNSLIQTVQKSYQVMYLVPFKLQMDLYLLVGEIAFLLQDKTGFRAIILCSQKTESNEYYETLASMYSYILSQWVTALLLEVRFCFVVGNHFYSVVEFDHNNIMDTIVNPTFRS